MYSIEVWRRNGGVQGFTRTTKKQANDFAAQARNETQTQQTIVTRPNGIFRICTVRMVGK